MLTVVPRERRQREVVVAVLVIHVDRLAQASHVAGGGDLQAVGQARGIAERRVQHPQFLGLGVHPGDELGFGSTDLLGDHDGDVVGGFGDQGADGVLDLDGRSRLQTELGGLGARGGLGDRHPVGKLEFALFNGLEHEVKRHNLGQRGRMALLIGAAVMQHLAGLHVDDDGCVFVGPGGGGCERERHQSQQAGADPRDQGVRLHTRTESSIKSTYKD